MRCSALLFVIIFGSEVAFYSLRYILKHINIKHSNNNNSVSIVQQDNGYVVVRKNNIVNKDPISFKDAVLLQNKLLQINHNI